MAQTPEESDYTAIQQRILEQDPAIANRKPDAIEKLPEDLQTAIGKLMPFADQAPDNPERAIPYEIRDYLELVDWSGRAVVEGKRGSIPENLPPILQRLKIDPTAYLKFINRSEKNRFSNFIGPVEACATSPSGSENPSSRARRRRRSFSARAEAHRNTNFSPPDGRKARFGVRAIRQIGQLLSNQQSGSAYSAISGTHLPKSSD